MSNSCWLSKSYRDAPTIICLVNPEWTPEQFFAEKKNREQEYGKLYTMSVDAAVEVVRKHFISPPKRITEERYIEMLEVLPPFNWVRGTIQNGGISSFKMSERTAYDITAIFVRVPVGCDGAEYFEMSNSIDMPHDDIVKIVRDFIASEGRS